MIEDVLRNKLAVSKHPAVLGVGSVLKADDAAGMILAEKLKKSAPDGMLVTAGSTAPENFTGVIKAFSPDTLFIADAAEMGLAPGDIRIIDTDDIAGISFSTHMLPLSLMLSYLKAEIGCEVVCIGIQPQSTAFGEPVCAAVAAAVENLYRLFKTTK